jgi:hypothetical protein
MPHSVPGVGWALGTLCVGLGLGCLPLGFVTRTRGARCYGVTVVTLYPTVTLANCYDVILNGPPRPVCGRFGHQGALLGSVEPLRGGA